MVQIRPFYLFLDFDGVMTTKFSNPIGFKSHLEFDSQCMFTLDQIYRFLKKRYTVLNVVIISNWRFEMNKEQLAALIQHPLIHTVSVLEEPTQKQKALEKYIEMNQLAVNSYLILDDEDLGEKFRSSQIRTRAEDGLRDTEGVLHVLSSYLKE